MYVFANYLSEAKKGPPKNDSSEYCFKWYKLDIVFFRTILVNTYLQLHLLT